MSIACDERIVLSCLRPRVSSERKGEPVCIGVPLPKGFLTAAAGLRVDGGGEPLPLDCTVLDRWSDGSARWVLLDFLAPSGRDREYVLTRAAQPMPAVEDRNGAAVTMRVEEGANGTTIDTGAARFVLRPPLLFASILAGSASTGPLIDPERTGVFIVAADGERRVRFRALALEQRGSVRVSVRLDGHVQAAAGVTLDVTARLCFFASSPVVKCAFTIRNPRRARHPGGKWVLGDSGSVLIGSARLEIAFASLGSDVRCSLEPNLPFERCDLPLEVYQDSSGGTAWRSPVHRNRNGEVRSRFRGYRVETLSGSRTGLRATPIVTAMTAAGPISLAVPRFWENCPRAVEASAAVLTFGFFPSQYGDEHELQGGEQKTHECVVAFGPDTVTVDPLTWCREPLLVTASPGWYAATGVVPYLTPASEDPHATYLALVQAALDGPDSFDTKRERVDEYGWRNFGDLYADHEAVHHMGPSPLVSHYNNQYDAIAGFAIQFMRTGDRHWWQLMDDLAGHVRDIDIYHTTGDKWAYNGGLFWHTHHYTDAGTATHRTYPREDDEGGGPSAEHNYTTGLTLHHYLTGSVASREAAVGLADWVLAMDDGDRTVFRWLARGETGLASATGSPLYHGPGRGAANSIVACLNAWQLTGEPRFLEKAEALLRRCIHPSDDIDALDLLDAERRWYYTVFLQAVGAYLELKGERAQRDQTYEYARESLLHYARWMADHEYPYLDRPEILEYPTETWDAQDVRKSEVFAYAALHATSAGERARFLGRAEYFFGQSTTRLAAWSTSALTRPLVIMLTSGFRHAWLARNRGQLPALHAACGRDFGLPAVFVPQKHRALRRARLLAAGGLLILVSGIVLLAWTGW